MGGESITYGRVRRGYKIVSKNVKGKPGMMWTYIINMDLTRCVRA
jgi:hypothetical protein